VRPPTDLCCGVGAAGTVVAEAALQLQLLTDIRALLPALASIDRVAFPAAAAALAAAADRLPHNHAFVRGVVFDALQVGSPPRTPTHTPPSHQGVWTSPLSRPDGSGFQVVDRHVACVMTADDTVRVAVATLYRHALSDGGGSRSGDGSASGSGREAWQLSADQHAAVVQMLQCAGAEVDSGVNVVGGDEPAPARGGSERAAEEAEEAEEVGGASAEAQLQHAETVLSQRTARFVLVLECVADQANRFGVYRTAEALGVHEVWVVLPPKTRASRGCINGVSKKAQQWLRVRHFASAEQCVQAARAEGRALWVTHLHAAAAVPLVAPLPLPPRLAVVMGSERHGVSDVMRCAADLVGVCVCPPPQASRCETLQGVAASTKPGARHWVLTPKRRGAQPKAVKCDLRPGAPPRCPPQVVCLPMHGFVESLNVTVASALVLQRLFDLCPHARGDLSADVRAATMAEWRARIMLRHGGGGGAPVS
jgi:tRNA G18 (ribose-2'-O)-methylase SpoU